MVEDRIILVPYSEGVPAKNTPSARSKKAASNELAKFEVASMSKLLCFFKLSS